MILLLIIYFIFFKTNLLIKNFFFLKIFFFNYIFVINNIYYKTFLNLSLINKLNGVHPILLYIALITLYKNNFIKKLFFYKSYFYFMIIISLFLGGYWANQEISWGGWWNWDPIEFILLGFSNLFLIYIHFKQLKLTFLKNFFKKFLKFFFFFNYLTIRVNFYNSIHNFISFDYYKNYIIIVYIYLCILNFFVIKELKFKVNFFWSLFLVILVNSLLVSSKIIERNYFFETFNFLKITFFIALLLALKRSIYYYYIYSLDIIVVILNLKIFFLKKIKVLHICINIFLVTMVLNFLWKYTLILNKEETILSLIKIKYNFFQKNIIFLKNYLIFYLCNKFIYFYINKFLVVYTYKIFIYIYFKIFFFINIIININYIFIMIFIKFKNFFLKK